MPNIMSRFKHRFVCNKFSYHESVTSLLKELDWPSLQQRRTKKRMTLIHRVVNETVDVEGSALITRANRSSRKINRVQYQTHSSKKDCYKYSFVARSIKWNNIDAQDDQFKSLLSTCSLEHAQMLFKERCSYTYRYRCLN